MHVVVALAPDLQVSLFSPAGTEAGIHVNGVPLGREPTPLLHGDRLTIRGYEMRFADEAMAGETVELPIVGGPRAAVPSAASLDARSGGRLVSRDDGRDYPVPAPPAGLTIGRAADCDLVIAQPAVSRRHARIEGGGDAGGYEIIDTSRNGVLVNDARVAGRVGLGKGDTIRIGDESFRFHADREPEITARTLSQVPSLQVTATTPVAVRVTPTAAPSPPAASEPEPVTAPPGSGTSRGASALASLEIINAGPTRGKRFDIMAPLAHAGRGEHNDVLVADDSVSDSHAKIFRRDGRWFVVDMGSTNGTYVNGERIRDEAQVIDGAVVRLGGVKMSFRIVGGVDRSEGETRIVVAVKGSEPRRSDARPKDRGRPLGGTDDARSPSSGRSLAVWGVLAALGAILVYLVLQGR